MCNLFFELQRMYMYLWLTLLPKNLSVISNLRYCPLNIHKISWYGFKTKGKICLLILILLCCFKILYLCLSCVSVFDWRWMKKCSEFVYGNAFWIPIQQNLIPPVIVFKRFLCLFIIQIFIRPFILFEPRDIRTLIRLRFGEIK